MQEEVIWKVSFKNLFSDTGNENGEREAEYLTTGLNIAISQLHSKYSHLFTTKPPKYHIPTVIYPNLNFYKSPLNRLNATNLLNALMKTHITTY